MQNKKHVFDKLSQVFIYSTEISHDCHIYSSLPLFN